MGKMETPDIETSSADYARRFAGPSGRYLLATQRRAVEQVLGGDRPGTVLDVGGGHGHLVDLFQARGWTPTVHGTDDACEANLRTLHGKRCCAFLKGDLLALPVPDRSYDLVIAVRLLSHVNAWPRLLAEMSRVARRTVIVDYPSRFALNVFTPLLFGLKKAIEGNTRTFTSFSHGELCREFAKHGFTFTRQSKQFFLPVGLHRVARIAKPLRGIEAGCHAVGLTSLAGSPVMLRVDRKE